MATRLLPRSAGDSTELPTDPQEVCEAFLAALADKDIETANALIDDDILYVNVGLPSVRGREQMQKVFDLLDKPEAAFEVYMHSISADGPTVLTERTDVLINRRLRAQFWVWGRFDVHDGRITLWRDSFDFLDIVRGALRGVASIFIPSIASVAPASVEDQPGR
ncbi:MAG: limonene-1,2-epoxide hydrolase family protein [Microthrixaceae bacterium]